MNIAVLSLTRDRLEYTRECFQSLRDNAGCEFDHFVLDQGSEDGTPDWLEEQEDITSVFLEENVGIARGLNYLLDEHCPQGFYDAIVSFDNDCEVVTPDTLERLCWLAIKSGWIVSPQILGLNNPLTPIREHTFHGWTIQETTHLGAIFRVTPGWVFDTFRFPESLPLWGGDEGALCSPFREQGGVVGYVKAFEAWHCEGTNVQRVRYPEYFERRQLEGAPA